jgi:hypothetical protein
LKIFQKGPKLVRIAWKEVKNIFTIEKAEKIILDDKI